MSENDNPVKIVNLRKEYHGFVSVNDLNLDIKKNSFTGLLGPNGAGKSTTLKILTHLINATSGNAYINGIDVTEDPKAALKGVGTVIETPEFYPYLTPRETMRYIGEIIGMNRETITYQTDSILEKVHMTDWADKKMGTFSKGMKQRVAIGQSLIDDPSLIILDEPTSGLDPRGMAEMRDILKNLRNDMNGLTVMMSSHMMYEVQDLCDRVAIINHGTLVLHDDISAITAEKGVRNLIIKTKDLPTDEIANTIGSLPYVMSSDKIGTEIHIRYNIDDGQTSDLFTQLGNLNIGVCEMREGDNLEARFLDLTKDSEDIL